MAEVKHTPGPWKQTGSLVYSPGKNGGTICEVSDPRVTETVEHHRADYGTKALEEAFANAAFIIRACNAHDDLLAALKSLVEQIEDYERVNNLAPNPGRKDCWDSVAQAKRAVAKAEGQPS